MYFLKPETYPLCEPSNRQAFGHTLVIVEIHMFCVLKII